MEKVYLIFEVLIVHIMDGRKTLTDLIGHLKPISSYYCLDLENFELRMEEFTFRLIQSGNPLFTDYGGLLVHMQK